MAYQSSIHDCADDEDVGKLSILLTQGHSPDTLDEHGQTLLHKCAREGHRKLCEVLLKHRASVNIKNKDGDTPLHNCIYKHKKDIGKMLLQCGADISAKNEWNKTPLEIARFVGYKVMENMLEQANRGGLKNVLSNRPIRAKGSANTRSSSEEFLDDKVDYDPQDVQTDSAYVFARPNILEGEDNTSARLKSANTHASMSSLASPNTARIAPQPNLHRQTSMSVLQPSSHLTSNVQGAESILQAFSEVGFSSHASFTQDQHLQSHASNIGNVINSPTTHNTTNYTAPVHNHKHYHKKIYHKKKNVYCTTAEIDRVDCVAVNSKVNLIDGSPREPAAEDSPDSKSDEYETDDQEFDHVDDEEEEVE